ncbi:MAG: ATP-binding cassette domain-containing protein [Thermosipho sp. (in: Bacteria)]|nr:ATP-binding cassette domain-containing protein [Thermosipho sp. (in: thermotogales)]
MPIKFINVSKKFKDVYAVKNLNFEIDDKKITVLIGPSGCGKTTTLKLINRLIERTSGEILINGLSIDKIDKIELRRKIGYVIQEIGLFPHYTVFDNIAVVPKLLNWPKNKIKNRVIELLNLVNLDFKEVINKYPYELSGGQRQRVGVARALAADPELLLMDEPFGAIDPINREILQDVLLNIQKKLKKTILFVTHDIREAIKLGDKIAVFKDGEIQQYDSTINLIKNPKNKFIENILGINAKLNYLEFVKVEKFIEKDFLVTNSISNINKIEKECLIIFTNKFEGFVLKTDIKKGHIKIRNDYVTPDQSVLEALNIMFKHNIHCLPVIEKNNEIKGIIKYEKIILK